MTSARLSIVVEGPVAQDKDVARDLRASQILPALGAGRHVVIDFSAVTTATQSFLHALLSEAFRTHGEELVETLEFKGCVEEIRQLISTVVEYSLRARTLTQEGLSGKLKKRDVPQADNLRVVRAVLDALALGSATPEDITRTTTFSLRHVHYRLHAARVLDLVLFGRNLASLTARGRELVATPPESAQERDAFVAAVNGSLILQKVCPGLLDRKAPTVSEVTRRIEQKTGLARATAARRAGALLSWRRSLVPVQAPLPGVIVARR